MSSRTQPKLSVGIVLPGLSRVASGGYKVIYEYASHMATHGDDVTIYHAPRFADWPLTNSPSPRESVSDLIRHNLPRNARPAWFALADEVKVKNRYRVGAGDLRGHDILVASAAETAPVVARTSSEQSVPGAYFIQHFEEWVGPNRVADTWTLPLQHVVIAPWLADISTNVGGSPILVPNAISAAHFPLGPPVTARPRHVLALVSDKSFKRTDIAIDVLNELAKARTEFSGATFGTIARPPGLHPAITHVQSPSPQQLRELYQSSRVYLCCSDAEGWHLPPAEAMASGSVVVSTEIPGVVAYGEGIALFAPAGDASGLLRQIHEALDDDERAQELADRGAAKMRAYTPDAAARTFREALRTIVERS
nr:glycosyltransferase family 4 protein [uncultured Nocardioides sp.]